MNWTVRRLSDSDRNKHNNKKKPNAKKSKSIIKPSWILHATIHQEKRDKLKSLGNYNFTILSSIPSFIIETVSYRLSVWFGMGDFLRAFCKTEFQYSHLKLTTNTAEVFRKKDELSTPLSLITGSMVSMNSFTHWNWRLLLGLALNTHYGRPKTPTIVGQVLKFSTLHLVSTIVFSLNVKKHNLFLPWSTHNVSHTIYEIETMIKYFKALLDKWMFSCRKNKAAKSISLRNQHKKPTLESNYFYKDTNMGFLLKKY